MILHEVSYVLLESFVVNPMDVSENKKSYFNYTIAS